MVKALTNWSVLGVTSKLDDFMYAFTSVSLTLSLFFKKKKEESLKVNFHLRREVGVSLTDASMRKELYYYIPGGRLDDVYSILNVTYWREVEDEEEEEEGGKACDTWIKIQGNHSTGQKFRATICRRTDSALSHRVFVWLCDRLSPINWV